eukprot:TRINITY_DN26032_c0_g1_i1.p2 TRINITY_DN26032_c0_g1~~TRINITY_DN26032_c0_g1_i1.p2  ORF type:complete len:181 (+),score=37.13 TRINITY_DN26032_c0_g1_i1:45-587(+)
MSAHAIHAAEAQLAAARLSAVQHSAYSAALSPTRQHPASPAVAEAHAAIVTANAHAQLAHQAVSPRVQPNSPVVAAAQARADAAQANAAAASAAYAASYPVSAVEAHERAVVASAALAARPLLSTSSYAVAPTVAASQARADLAYSHSAGVHGQFSAVATVVGNVPVAAAAANYPQSLKH